MEYTLGTYALKNSDKLFVCAMLDLARKRLQNTWHFDDASAQIVLVDLDTSEGRDFWQNCSHHDICIGFAQNNGVSARWFLEKPLRVHQLIDLLGEMEASLPKLLQRVSIKVQVEQAAEKSLVSAQQHVTRPISEAPQSYGTYIPENFLSGLLVQHLKHPGQAQCVSLSGMPSLYVLPDEKRCFTKALNFTRLNKQLLFFYGAKAHQLIIQNYTKPEVMHQVTAQQLYDYPIETFIWLATIASSNGRPLGIYTSNTLVQLKQWPNFAVLPHDIKHMSLAAALLKQPISATWAAKQTSTDIETVVNFINACYLLGLVAISNKISSSDAKHTTQPHERRSLFRNLLSRLIPDSRS